MLHLSSLAPQAALLWDGQLCLGCRSLGSSNFLGAELQADHIHKGYQTIPRYDSCGQTPCLAPRSGTVAFVWIIGMNTASLPLVCEVPVVEARLTGLTGLRRRCLGQASIASVNAHRNRRCAVESL